MEVTVGLDVADRRDECLLIDQFVEIDVLADLKLCAHVVKNLSPPLRVGKRNVNS